MTLAAYEGRCPHCGHDHGSPFATLNNAPRVAELELENLGLRETLLVAHDLSTNTITRVLNTPPSTSALAALVEKVERRTIERCLDCYSLDDSAKDWAYKMCNLPVGNLKLEELL